LKAATLIAQSTKSFAVLSGIALGKKCPAGSWSSTSQVWADIVETPGTDWSVAQQIPQTNGRRLLLECLKSLLRRGNSTPAQDRGRDVIATERSFINQDIGSARL
jgi:hypothetical protein